MFSDKRTLHVHVWVCRTVNAASSGCQFNYDGADGRGIQSVLSAESGKYYPPKFISSA